MNNAKKIVILFQKITDNDNFCLQFTQLDFPPLKVAKNLGHLRELLEEENPEICVCFTAPAIPMNVAIATVRTLLGSGGLIAVTEQIDSQLAKECLIAGADAVMPAHRCEPSEILAWKTALQRRAEGFLREMGHSSAKKPPAFSLPSTDQAVWRLTQGGWCLVSPEGIAISLTSSEKFFLEHFVGQPDKRVNREEVLEDNEHYAKNSRAIDSLVSRLRRKAAEHDVDLPLKSVHGWGYSFTGLLLPDGVDMHAGFSDFSSFPNEEP